jgi:hypothetical protein
MTYRLPSVNTWLRVHVYSSPSPAFFQAHASHLFLAPHVGGVPVNESQRSVRHHEGLSMNFELHWLHYLSLQLSVEQRDRLTFVLPLRHLQRALSLSAAFG